MTFRTTKTIAKVMPWASAAAVALMLVGTLSGPAFAADPDPVDSVPSGQSYEIHDPADTPPVNYRSEQDERYNTPAQHDAEMYAEEYERMRDEKRLKEKSLLDNMNTLTSPGGPMNSNLQSNDAGFSPKAPY